MKNTKKLIALLLATAMVGVLPAHGAMAKEFADVPTTAWYASTIRYVSENGLFDGTSATTFTPEATMTVGMFLTVLARVSGADMTVTQGQAWYDPAVKWAEENHITDGANGTTDTPTAEINRQTAAVLMRAYFAYKDVNLKVSLNAAAAFTDEASIADWAVKSVNELRFAAVLKGTNGAFNPTGTLTRAEAAAMLMRMDMISKGKDPDEKPPVEIRDDNAAEWFKTKATNFDIEIQNEDFKFEDVFAPEVLAKFDGTLNSWNRDELTGKNYIYVNKITDNDVVMKREDGVFAPQSHGTTEVRWGCNFNGKAYYTTATITIVGLTGLEEAEQGRIKNRAWAQQVVADLCKPGMTDAQKVAAIGNFMCDYMSYGTDGKADWWVTGAETVPGIPMSKPLAGCQGYAARFTAFCYEAGIQCHIIGGSNHVWNYVKCDGVWYNVDISGWDMFHTEPMTETNWSNNGSNPEGVYYMMEMDPTGVFTKESVPLYYVDGYPEFESWYE